ncbi:formylglycine-generating enzyme family protein [Candidatus Poribacteria bacterium]
MKPKYTHLPTFLMLCCILTTVCAFIVRPVRSEDVGKASPISNPGHVNTAGDMITGRDGASMVLIPAGEFSMGDVPNDGYSDEQPSHRVYLDAFHIDVYQVTNALYKKFVTDTGHSAPKSWKDSRFNEPDQPVVGVNWDDAVDYAEWAGKRLPTEAEWEKAARGGLIGKRYPWGDEASHNNANYCGISGKDNWPHTSPVGQFAPNGYGLYDIAGNVWEWCADWYDENYYARSPVSNPRGPDSGSYRVLRGGNWAFIPYSIRVSNRDYYPPKHTYYGIGFRCILQN